MQTEQNELMLDKWKVLSTANFDVHKAHLHFNQQQQKDMTDLWKTQSESQMDLFIRI